MHARNRRTASSALAAVSLTVALTMSFTTPASAEEDHAAAEELSTLIQEVAPRADLAAAGVVTSTAARTNVDGVKTTVPLAPGDNIVVTDEAGRAAYLSLPDELTVGRGMVAEDGTVVYSDTSASGDAIAVQTLSDGTTRVQTIIAGPDSPHEFAYAMKGYDAMVNDAGEAIFFKADGSFVPVAAAWARDADGNAVPTSYEVRGKELVQVVRPTPGTVYPVVADPSWVWIGAGWGMKLTRTETARVRDYAAALGMCAVFVKRAAALNIACAVWGSYIQLRANLAQGDSPRTCLFFNVAPAPGTIWRVKC